MDTYPSPLGGRSSHRLFLQKLNLGWVVDILERYLRLNNLDLEISFLLEYCILMWFSCWGLKIRSHSWGKGYRVFSEGSSDYIINLKASMIILSHSIFTWQISQFSSVTQSCLTLCNPMDCSTPGFPVHHQLLEFAQTHVRWVCDAIQPSHPLSSPSPPTFNFFQHQGLFNESVLCISWPKYWSFSFSISPSSEYSGLISFRIDWFDLPAVQGTLKSLLQHPSSKVSILWCSAFSIVQLSQPYTTTGKTIPFTRRTFVGKVISLLFNMLPR